MRKSPREIFHIVSYLQYPLMIGSLFFYIPFILSLIERNPDWNVANYVLILLGVGLSFSTLQDTRKTQNKISRKVWESPSKGKAFLVIITILALTFIISGLLLLYFSVDESISELGTGITILGIGFIGILKSAVEMFENHRKDRNHG